METVAERLEPIQVTVTFLEMKRPPANYAHPPANLSVALMRTRDIPLHYYRYLIDRVGRKWHWVNVLRLSDEALDRIDVEAREPLPLVEAPLLVEPFE